MREECPCHSLQIINGWPCRGCLRTVARNTVENFWEKSLERTTHIEFSSHVKKDVANAFSSTLAVSGAYFSSRFESWSVCLKAYKSKETHFLTAHSSIVLFLFRHQASISSQVKQSATISNHKVRRCSKLPSYVMGNT